MEKTENKKKKKNDKKVGNEEDESNCTMKEQEKLRNKVTNLIKKQKLPAVRQIVRGQVDSRPWSQDIKAKVYASLILSI